MEKQRLQLIFISVELFFFFQKIVIQQFSSSGKAIIRNHSHSVINFLFLSCQHKILLQNYWANLTEFQFRKLEGISDWEFEAELDQVMSVSNFNGLTLFVNL